MAGQPRNETCDTRRVTRKSRRKKLQKTIAVEAGFCGRSTIKGLSARQSELLDAQVDRSSGVSLDIINARGLR